MIKALTTSTVGDIVASDFRTAGVFEQFGIDFCCGGRRSIAEACQTATVDPDVVIKALDALPDSDDSGDQVAGWSPDRIVEHIVETHHAYVRWSLPMIGRYLAKLLEVHGARHPELAAVRIAFARLARDLEQHMVKEERVLFPYICELAWRDDDCGHAPSPFGTVENPILMMEREHRAAADDLRTIRELTNNYTPPADGCTTYEVCLAELARFEADLHRHVHLENNILFPAAIALESASALRDKEHRHSW
jgi:regulator of cell morphogenesis and NO signaling